MSQVRSVDFVYLSDQNGTLLGVYEAVELATYIVSYLHQGIHLRCDYVKVLAMKMASNPVIVAQ